MWSTVTVRTIMKVIEVKDRWLKVRVTMDAGAAGHVVLEAMFHVKLERKTSSKKFVASNGEQIKDLVEKNIPFETYEGIQRCITYRKVRVLSNVSFQCRNLSELDTLSCWMKRTRTFEIFETERCSSWT